MPSASQVFSELIAEEDVDSVNTLETKPTILTGKASATGKIAFNAKRKVFEISLKGLDKKSIPNIERAIKGFALDTGSHPTTMSISEEVKAAVSLRYIRGDAPDTPSTNPSTRWTIEVQRYCCRRHRFRSGQPASH